MFSKDIPGSIAMMNPEIRTALSILKAALRALGFHIHTWGEWKIEGDVVRTKDNGIIARTQVRQCEQCKKLQSGRIWLV